MLKLRYGLILLIPLPVFAQQCDTTQPDSHPLSRYGLGVPGVVTDKTTGLMWKRCAEGQHWGGKACQGAPKAMTMIEAAGWIKQANVKDKAGGFGDWRLPTQDELLSLVQGRCSDPAINRVAFPGTPSASFWTASQGSGTVNSFWTVDFRDGFDGLFNRGQAHHLRLVRKP